MSLAQIKTAVGQLTPQEFTELAEFIERADKSAWDRQIEEDFSPGGRLQPMLAAVDRQIDAGESTPLP